MIRFALLALLALPGQDTPPPPAPVEIESASNVVYGKSGGEDLKMDIAWPKNGKGPFPAVVFIHGGGWMGGSNKAYAVGIQELAKQGYVSATVEYRFAPKHVFPAQIEDVKLAIRWLRENAPKYKLDPAGICLWGDSAGSHLAALLAVTDPKDKLEGKGCDKQSSRVQAVVCYYGAFDLAAAYEHAEKIQPPQMALMIRFLLVQFLGGTPQDAAQKYKAASPVTYVTKDDPPFLLIHGEKDELVPIEQSEILEKKLKDAGVEVEFLRVKDVGHGFGGQPFLDSFVPAGAFIKKHLKK